LIGETNDSGIAVLAIGSTECFRVGELSLDDLEVGRITLCRAALHNRLLLGYLLDTRGGSDTLACTGKVLGVEGGDG